MAGSRNISVSEDSRPVLPRHAKLKFDETRQVWVILAPERVLAPDEIAVDVIAMLQDLADKGFLTQAREKTS
jgi:pyrroloquinoline quinone biosynthesis protein D